MTEINQNLYLTSMTTLTSAGIPEPLADAASRVVASDDPNKPDLGRNDADTQVCQTVTLLYNNLTKGRD